VTNDVPVARLSGPVLAYKNTLLTWDGSMSSDGNADPLTYLWNFGDGTSAITSGPTANHGFGSVGNYTVSLVVNDGETNSIPATQTVTIQSKPPIANAGSDQTVVQRTKVTLNGGASSDPDGVIAKAIWKQVSGPTVSLAGSSTLTATFVAPRVSTSTKLVFSLAVTDNDGVQASDQIVVTVTRR
jgi:PKD repeat protein